MPFPDNFSGGLSRRLDFDQSVRIQRPVRHAGRGAPGMPAATNPP
jgi:hypothetical protein